MNDFLVLIPFDSFSFWQPSFSLCFCSFLTVQRWFTMSHGCHAMTDHFCYLFCLTVFLSTVRVISCHIKVTGWFILPLWRHPVHSCKELNQQPDKCIFGVFLGGNWEQFISHWSKYYSKAQYKSIQKHNPTTKTQRKPAVTWMYWSSNNRPVLASVFLC